MSENDIFLENINLRLASLMHPNTDDLFTIRGALDKIGSKIGGLYMDVIKIRTSVYDKAHFKNKHNYTKNFKTLFRLKYCVMVYALLYDKIDRNDIIFDDAFFQSFKSMLRMCTAIQSNYKNGIGTELFNELHTELLTSEIKKMSSTSKVERIIGIK